MPISSLPVQNEDCSSTTRGGRPRIHEGKNYQAWYLTGVPTEYTSPPIRYGVPHIPKPISHEPPLPTGTSSSFSLTTKKNGENRGKKALSEHFDNKSSIWPAAPIGIFSNWQTSPTEGSGAIIRKWALSCKNRLKCPTVGRAPFCCIYK